MRQVAKLTKCPSWTKRRRFDDAWVFLHQTDTKLIEDELNAFLSVVKLLSGMGGAHSFLNDNAF